MAFMAPAPDQGTLYNGRGLARSMNIPMAMSPSDSMASLEKLMEGGGAGPFTARSATTSPTGGGYWGQDMVAMLGGAQAGVAAELLGGSAMVSSDWQALLDAKSASYKYLPPVSMAPAMRHGVAMENARVREMLAGKSTGKAWSAMEVAGAGITVDPSKGGLALQAVGLATSHCLADPAFAERAAKSSSFGSGGKYPQITLPLPVSDKPRSRSAETSGRLSRTSSNAKKLAAAVAAEMEDKQGVSAAAAHAAAAATQAAAAAGVAAAEISSCDVEMEVDGVSINDDKSPPGPASAQSELEAIEGVSLATMDHSTHEVDVPAAQEPTNSCSAEQQQQQRGGATGSSPAASPSRSPSGSDDSHRRKRKNSPAATDKPHADPKAADVVDSKPKRWKGERVEDDAAKAKAERSCSDNSGDSGSPRAHEASHKHPKDLSKQDYIHVRARRGQATDSHSLAERVRREKISERMKYLQDLVPGCSKVTGKAVMLDEIINYVQSLQRQVENLSMKLASVNPGPAAARLDYGFESALTKESLQSRLGGGSSLGAAESSATFGMLQHQQHQQQHHHINSLGSHCGLDFRALGGPSSGMDGFLRRSNSAPINVASGLTSVDTFGDDVSPSSGWDGELQSIVNQMGFGGHQGRFGLSILDGFHSQLPVGHMKVEM